MTMRRWTLPLCLVALASLCGCGSGDYNGFGETEGWGGYTKGFGDVDESYKPVGLCSYLGGCMTDENSPNTSVNTYKGTDRSGAHAGGVDDSGSH